MSPNTPPTAQEVVKRLKVLHWAVEFARRVPPPGQWAEIRTRLSPDQLATVMSQWEHGRDELCGRIRSAWHWEAMTGGERELAQTLPCDVTEQQLANALWALESVGVLLWALERIEKLPPFDTPFDDPALLGLVRQPLETVQLRSLDAIQSMREIAELWHWRSRTRQLVLEGLNPAPEAGFPDLDSVVRWSAKKARAGGLIPEIIAEDFAAKGKAYRELTELEWSQVRSVAMERHHALNWLCGYARNNRWDETPTET